MTERLAPHGPVRQTLEAHRHRAGSAGPCCSLLLRQASISPPLPVSSNLEGSRGSPPAGGQEPRGGHAPPARRPRDEGRLWLSGRNPVLPVTGPTQATSLPGPELLEFTDKIQHIQTRKSTRSSENQSLFGILFFILFFANWQPEFLSLGNGVPPKHGDVNRCRAGHGCSPQARERSKGANLGITYLPSCREHRPEALNQEGGEEEPEGKGGKVRAHINHRRLSLSDHP